MRIFLSAVTDEFCDYRDQLASDLTRHNVDVKVQEDFKDSGTVLLEKLDLYIANCDAVVHLVGDMTGSTAGPESTQAILVKYPDLTERFQPLRDALNGGAPISNTQWEAWLALYHGKALLIAQAAPSAERGPAYAPTAEMRVAQEQHLARLRAIGRYPGSTFASPDELAKQIAYTAILDRLAEEYATLLSPRASAVPSGALIGGLLIMLAAPALADQWGKTLGMAVSGPLMLALAASLLVLMLAYTRYFGLLGAGDAPPGSPARLGYERFRAGLAGGGSAAQLYKRWLTAFLDRVDGFFGDAGQAGLTLWPRAFGLRAPAPLWTAPSLDRCLLLAQIYPIVTIYVLWAFSGHVGPAEKVLGLASDAPGWQRGALVASLGVGAYCARQIKNAKRWVAKFLWLAAGFAVAAAAAGAAAFAGAGAGAGAGAIAVAVAVTVTFTFAGVVADVVAGATAVAVAVAGAVVVAGVSTLAEADADAVTAAIAIAGAGALTGAVTGAAQAISNFSIGRQRQGMFLTLFVSCAILTCLSAALMLAAHPSWREFGPLVLFLSLLTLLNAPFDWASLGLTRALLRRGLELQGWWPLLLAVVDALLAGVVIALLALAMVLGVQIFNALAVHGGGNALLPLRSLLDGIAAKPGEPEYWWVYALLISTLIPSLLNLIIGGTALLRGVPMVSSLLLWFMPAGAAVPTHERAWMAAVLTLQMALGIIFGLVVQVGLAYLLLFYLMPTVGLSLLDICRALVDLDFPATIIRSVVAVLK
ncbi:MAG: hypothetical protein EKK41_15760 [Hyphomicrobiales bacterium]|nr:MAG: hypothetical protein EKK41_15760 [Hyphomicrobiales bacterium]